MFFILSKILHFLLDPLVWIVILLLWGLISKRKKILVIATATLLFFSNPFIINELLQWWEIPSVKKENLNKDYEAGIVLGGFIKFYNSDMERANFGAGADRLMQTIDLFNTGKIEKIIITSGSGRLTDQSFREAEIAKNLLREINLPDNKILTESNSRNTFENAKYTAELIEEKNLQGPFLLITSGYHMRRSLAVFENAGIQVDPYPVDVLSGKRTFTPDKLIIPSAEALASWNVLIHEWVGFLVYEILGYS